MFNNDEKCIAYISCDLRRCSRNTIIGDFCKTHHKKHEEHTLKFGVYKGDTTPNNVILNVLNSVHLPSDDFHHEE